MTDTLGNEQMKAWHFTRGMKLRDGRPVPPIGEKLVHDGELVMCEGGLHASKRLLDALDYAPGTMLHRVELGGTIIHDDDKSVASERTIIWSIDAEDMLRDFARRCALDVIHLWDAPEVVVRYLKTGDESLRATAWGAAQEAQVAAGWTTARNATPASARNAARAATRNATSEAAWAASRSVAWATAREAGWAATLAAQNRRITAMAVAEHKRQSRSRV